MLGFSHQPQHHLCSPTERISHSCPAYKPCRSIPCLPSSYTTGRGCVDARRRCAPLSVLQQVILPLPSSPPLPCVRTHILQQMLHTSCPAPAFFRGVDVFLIPASQHITDFYLKSMLQPPPLKHSDWLPSVSLRAG